MPRIDYQDGMEGYRRRMLDFDPSKKAATDKLLGQSAETATSHGFGKYVQSEGLYAYPEVDGSLREAYDAINDHDAEIVQLNQEIVALREEMRRRPFG